MDEQSRTDAQKRAIYHRGSDLLVSASAGSGKTSTLTARLIDLLCSPESDVAPSEVLAVTFTRAAADEMRQRLFRAAADEIARSPHNVRARRLLSSIDRVQISTIHSFCQSAIRPYFSELSLSPDFRIADEAESKRMRERAMNDVITEMLRDESASGDLSLLSEILGDARNESSLDETLLSVCSVLANKGTDSEALAGYADMLEEYASKDVFDTPLGDVIKKTLVEFGEYYEKIFDHYAPLLDCEPTVKYVPDCEGLSGFAKTVKTAAGITFSEAKKAIVSIEIPNMPRGIKLADLTQDAIEYREYRGKFKDSIDVLKDEFFRFSDEEIAPSLLRSAELDRAAARVVSKFEERLGEIKREQNALDYGDLERYAHRLFVGKDGKPTEAARRTAARFRYVFIDEYQDTNLIQDEIFRAVSSSSERFMVGDVKQSIYSFRGADPKVFSRVRRDFVAGKCGDYVFMSENFRSSSNVISYTNAVSRIIFPFSQTPFDKSDELIFARRGADETNPSELVILSQKIPAGTDEEGKVRYAEGMSEERYVALRINELLSSGKKADGSPIKPGDVAILIRAANVRAKKFADELARLSIPVSVQAKRDIFADRTMLSLVCLLGAVCESELDVNFTGALRSAVFGFSLSDVVRLRLDRRSMPICSALEECAASDEGELGKKCRRASAVLRELRSICAVLSPDAFIRHMSKTLDLESALASGGVSRSSVRSAVRELRALAKKAADAGYTTLVQFFSFLRGKMDSSERSEAAAPAADAVNIVSIHHSKGLEFPICFVTYAAAKFNFDDTKKGVIFDPSFGIAAKLPDKAGLVKCDTLLRRIEARIKANEETDEEMRDLYVAMTRAKDRLIVTASADFAEKEFDDAVKAARFRCAYTVRRENGYLGWLAAPLADGEECGAKLVIPELDAGAQSAAPAAMPDKAAEEAARTEAGRNECEATDEADVEALAKLFASRFDFEYPYKHLAKIPAKLTVSRLYPEILDEEPELEAAKDIVLGEKAPVPRFMAQDGDEANVGEKAAAVGTATHVFMQFCDHNALAGEGDTDSLVRAELDRLLRDRFIDEKSASLVDLSQISAFVRSPLFARIRRARRVWREFRFNAARDASAFTADPDLAAKLSQSREKVIVQGVVDLLFEDENGNFVLVDYKTDRLTDYERSHPDAGKETLRERHKNQLSYYRDIVGEMTERPIDETLIYSLTLADVVEIG